MACFDARLITKWICVIIVLIGTLVEALSLIGKYTKTSTYVASDSFYCQRVCEDIAIEAWEKVTETFKTKGKIDYYYLHFES